MGWKGWADIRKLVDKAVGVVTGGIVDLGQMRASFRDAGFSELEVDEIVRYMQETGEVPSLDPVPPRTLQPMAPAERRAGMSDLIVLLVVGVIGYMIWRGLT